MSKNDSSKWHISMLMQSCVWRHCPGCKYADKSRVWFLRGACLKRWIWDQVMKCTHFSSSQPVTSGSSPWWRMVITHLLYPGNSAFALSKWLQLFDNLLSFSNCLRLLCKCWGKFQLCVCIPVWDVKIYTWTGYLRSIPQWVCSHNKQMTTAGV